MGSKDFYHQSQVVKIRSRSSPPMDVDVPKNVLVTQNILKGSKQTIEEGKNSQSSNNNESENDWSEGSNGSLYDLNNDSDVENDKDIKLIGSQKLSHSERRYKLISFITMELLHLNLSKRAFQD